MPKPNGAGDLCARIKWQRRQDGDDEYGNPVTGWADIGVERAASLTPTRGGETVQAGRIAGTATWDCWVRNDSGTRTINTGDRAVDVRDPTRTFNVAFAEDMDGDRKWILVQLTSGKVDG